jgi:hypothetical protein
LKKSERVRIMFIITKPDNRIGATAPATPKAAVLICYRKKELAMLHPPQEDNAVVTRLSEEPGRLKSCLDMTKGKRRVYLRLLAHLRAAADEVERSHIPEQPDAVRR